MTYGNEAHTGYFESFTSRETADLPFLFEIDWIFKVERSVKNLGNGIYS